MYYKYALTVALLSSTMLVGCKEQAKESQANLNQPGTFAVNIESEPLIGSLQHLEASRLSDQAVPKRDKIDDLVQYVNPFIGTTAVKFGTKDEGNNNPGAQMPFGMVNFGPDTALNPSGYEFPGNTIDHFALTHLNGPGCKGQGLVAIKPRINLSAALQEFVRNDAKAKIESASPGYYSAKTTDGVTTELSVTVRTGMARFTYPAGKIPSITIDPGTTGFGPGVPADLIYTDIDFNSNSIYGKTSNGAFCSGTWRSAMYFYAEFEQNFTPQSKINGAKAVDLLFLPSDKEQAIHMRIGISSVSVENARKNLNTENSTWDFDGTRKKASDEWNTRLNAVQLDLAKPEKLAAISDEKKKAAKDFLTQFYSGIYRSLIAPTVYSDINGDYRSMRQEKPDGKNFPAENTEPNRQTENVKNYPFANDGKPRGYHTHYSGFSLWDTYRALTQFQALLYPAEVSEMMQSLIADAQQCGALPHWVDGSEDATAMQGDHAPNAIAGAYAFGARNFDIANAAKYMWQSQSDVNSACNDKPSIDREIGGPYAKFYFEHNYIPTDFHAPWRVRGGSQTLEAAIAAESTLNFFGHIANKVSGNYGDKKTIDLLVSRAKGWEHIFNDNIKKLSAKDSKGRFEINGDNFLEGSREVYLWTFAHDWTSLIDKLGGKPSAITALDELMSMPSSTPFTGEGPEPKYGAFNTNIMGSKLYIGNEMSFQTPWAYNWAGDPSRAQYIIPQIMKKTFFNTPGGLPGNDDLGSLSNWYVWASLGLYPVIPSVPGLAMSTPQVDGITIWMGNGKSLRLETNGNNAFLDDEKYISSVTFNDKNYEATWLPLDVIKNGGVLKYTLSKTPTRWASDDKYAPPSGVETDYSKPTARLVTNLVLSK